jgi:hypothetical protein
MEIRSGSFLATVSKESLRGRPIYTYHVYQHDNGRPTEMMYCGSDPELANCTRAAEAHVEFLASQERTKRAA